MKSKTYRLINGSISYKEDILRKNKKSIKINFIENNKNLKKKIIEIEHKLKNNLPTIPSTIGEELACNIFLRAKNLKDFSKLRDLKDNF